MFKKSILMLTLAFVMMPLLAQAYSLTTRINKIDSLTDGQLQVNAYAVQTSGAATKIIANGTNVNVVITPANGYVISQIQQGTTYLTVTPTGQTINIPATNTATQSINVWFDKSKIAVSANSGIGGSATPSGVLNLQVGTTKVFTFTPAAGKNVISISGLPAGTVLAPAVLPAAVNAPVTATITVPATGPVTMNAVFTAAIANAGVSQTKLINTLVTLNGAASTGVTSYAWTQTGGPAVVLSDATAQKPTFTPAATGVYKFTLAINGDASTAVATTVTATDSYAVAMRSACVDCHAGNTSTAQPNGIGGGYAANSAYKNWSASGHKSNSHGPQTCQACHVGADTGGHPGVTCLNSCHGPTVTHTYMSKVGPGAIGTGCAVCHAGSTDAHAEEQGCIDCHAINLNSGAGFVQDNNGVRAIMPEFTKRSHHITGATPTNAQCIVCHMEGKGGGYGVHVDPAYHLKDNKIYLRNADTNAAIVWSGTEHTNMDNFCFSCHDSDGFSGVTASGIKATPGTTLMSSTNPFGDTLTNTYDQVARAGVVDVKTAFTTTNASHHAVSGQRYKFRFSTRANADAWTAAKAGRPHVADSEIAVGNTDLDGAVIPAAAFDNTNSAGVVGGGTDKTTNKGMNDKTLFEADKFVEAYIPLGSTEEVGDNSLLHCGDCHTVGQWKAGSSMAADGTPAVAIGAHGSANEYLLRNSLGTDALHSAQTYICFSCHGINGEAMEYLLANDALYDELIAEGELSSTAVRPTWRAGWGATHPNVLAGQVEGYATAHSVVGFHAQCQVDSSSAIGAGTQPIVAGTRTGLNNGGGHKDRTLDFIPAAGATAAYPSAASDSGNVTGIACTNCHNSGLRSGWGGIHGGNNTYTDGLNRAQTTYRFMPGMGNYRYAPPGGWNGKDVSDPQLVTLPGAGPGAGKPMGGCYTNGAADMNPGFSSCSHHGTSTAAIPAGIIAVTGGSRTTLGGGTASNATAAEPTVRESSSGNIMVTRPLKY